MSQMQLSMSQTEAHQIVGHGQPDEAQARPSAAQRPQVPAGLVPGDADDLPQLAVDMRILETAPQAPRAAVLPSPARTTGQHPTSLIQARPLPATSAMLESPSTNQTPQASIDSALCLRPPAFRSEKVDVALRTAERKGESSTAVVDLERIEAAAVRTGWLERAGVAAVAGRLERRAQTTVLAGSVGCLLAAGLETVLARTGNSLLTAGPSQCARISDGLMVTGFLGLQATSRSWLPSLIPSHARALGANEAVETGIRWRYASTPPVTYMAMTLLAGMAGLGLSYSQENQCGASRMLSGDAIATGTIASLVLMFGASILVFASADMAPLPDDFDESSNL